MEEKIIKCINNILENKDFKEKIIISNDTNLRDDLGFDSFDLAELTVLLEEETGIDIFEKGVIYTFQEIKQKLNV
jgi:acyl carrier protein